MTTDKPWGKPTVGLPTVHDGGCAFSPTPEVQACGKRSEWHIVGRSTAWGPVGLEACFRHLPVAMTAVNELYEVHQYGELCMKGECCGQRA